jgi:hypothetical protein
MIAFNGGKIRKNGCSYVITVPKQYVDNGILKQGQLYQVLLKEVEQDGKEEGKDN